MQGNKRPRSKAICAEEVREELMELGRVAYRTGQKAIPSYWIAIRFYKASEVWLDGWYQERDEQRAKATGTT